MNIYGYSSPHLGITNNTEIFKDPTRARFTTCALKYIAAIPALVAGCIILGFLLKFLLRGWRVEWLTAFIKEPQPIPEQEADDASKKEESGSRAAAALLFACSLVGLVLHILTEVTKGWDIESFFLTAAWIVAGGLVAILRPKTTPFSILVLFISILTCQLILIVDGIGPHQSRYKITAALEAVTSFLGIVTILLMPLRSPSLPDTEISPPFAAPTADLRSPEDNLTLWQYMSVSWMAPLMNLGNKRQLNDEDVWSLGYEFKHRLLHEVRLLPSHVPPLRDCCSYFFVTFIS